MAMIEKADCSSFPEWLRKAIAIDREERKRKNKADPKREQLKREILEMLRSCGIK